MGLSYLFLALTALATLTVATPRFPKFRDPADDPPRRPNVHDTPYQGPNSPGGGNPWSNFGQNQDVPQAQINSNMGTLEQKIARNKDLVIEAGFTMMDVVSAILATPQTTQFASQVEATATPTITVPSTSYNACRSFASHVRSCASATTSFYYLPAASQASCACYTTESSRYFSCGPSSQQVAYPSVLAKDIFDYHAGTCHNYLGALGYSNAANAMSGRSANGNKTVLGAGFCDRIDDEEKKARNGSIGLSPTMGIKTLGACSAIPTATARASRGGASGRFSALQTVDHNMLVSTASYSTIPIWSDQQTNSCLVDDTDCSCISVFPLTLLNGPTQKMGTHPNNPTISTPPPQTRHNLPSIVPIPLSPIPPSSTLHPSLPTPRFAQNTPSPSHSLFTLNNLS